MKKDESDDGTMKTKNRIPPPEIIEVRGELVHQRVSSSAWRGQQDGVLACLAYRAATPTRTVR